MYHFVVPFTTAKVELTNITDYVDANIFINSIDPLKSCGKNKYIFIVVLNTTMEKSGVETLQTLNQKLRQGKNFTLNEYDKYLVYKTNTTALNFVSENAYLGNCRENMTREYIEQNPTVNYTIEDLHYYSNYSILVYLCNEFGCGDPSEPIEIQTDEYLPFCSALNLTIHETSPTSIQLRWLDVPRSCANGIIVGYTVYARRLRNDTVAVWNVSAVKMSEYIGLEEYELYCVKIAAKTKVGQGVNSSEVCGYTDQYCKFILYQCFLFIKSLW